MTERLTLADGTVVEIDGEGPPIVMVHGWPDTARMWDPQVAALAPGHRCVRFTLPGYSEATARRVYTLDELLATIGEAVRIAGGGAPVTLLLHDWGCVFGYRWALRHPELVARIVGVDIGDAGTKEYMRSLPARAKAGIVAYQWWLAAAWKIGGGIGDRMTRRMAAIARAPGEPSTIRARMNYPYWLAWTGGLGRTRSDVAALTDVPMFFAYGRRKPFLFHSHGWAERLAARPRCMVRGYDTGHWVTVQAGPAFNADLGGWLDATAVPGAR